MGVLGDIGRGLDSFRRFRAPPPVIPAKAGIQRPPRPSREIRAALTAVRFGFTIAPNRALHVGRAHYRHHPESAGGTRE